MRLFEWKCMARDGYIDCAGRLEPLQPPLTEQSQGPWQCTNPLCQVWSNLTKRVILQLVRRITRASMYFKQVPCRQPQTSATAIEPIHNRVETNCRQTADHAWSVHPKPDKLHPVLAQSGTHRSDAFRSLSSRCFIQFYRSQPDVIKRGHDHSSMYRQIRKGR